MAGAGVPLLVISRVLGHSSIMQTQVYSHLADDALQAGVDAAANAMGSAWTEAKQPPAQP
jgi:site-specific recombinase XerD